MSSDCSARHIVLQHRADAICYFCSRSHHVKKFKLLLLLLLLLAAMGVLLMLQRNCIICRPFPAASRMLTDPVRCADFVLFAANSPRLVASNAPTPLSPQGLGFDFRDADLLNTTQGRKPQRRMTFGGLRTDTKGDRYGSTYT